VKELQGWARAELEVATEACFELLAGIERYPAWFEVVREVEILEREQNGTPGIARAALHVPQSPFGTDFELFMAGTDRAAGGHRADARAGRPT